jgi:hypothetical protein
MTLKTFHFYHSFFLGLIFPPGQDLSFIAVELEQSEKLLKNLASVIYQFANAQKGVLI